MENKKRIYQNIASALLAVIVWQLAALALNESILLASPIDVLAKLPSLWLSKNFWGSVWFSLSRIGLGFIMGMLSGVIFAGIAYTSEWFEIILRPYIAVIKSVPVASFVILALLWLTSSTLPVLIAFLIVFPVIYANILKGLQSTDKKMLEMAKVFRLSFWKKIIYIFLPQIKPYIISASSIAIGLAWKSGVAAEIIGIPGGSIGEALYYSKVYLDVPELFAWTLTVVLLSIACEKLFTLILKFLFKKVEKL